MKRAFVFPGQGSQYGGMGKELFDTCPQARATFEEADERLGFALSQLCFEGPEEKLRLTEHTQPAILTTSVAAFRCLQTHGVEFHFVAGHSLGEYSAVVAAGGLNFGDAVETVRARGRLMQQAVSVGQGAMAAILGLDQRDIEKICREVELETRECVAAANINSPAQIVIAGSVSGVAAAGQRCKQAGARRVIDLTVSAPFHCAMMKPAQDRLEGILEDLDFQDLQVSLINNVDAAEVRTGALVRDGLVRQVSAAVRWLDCVRVLLDAGVSEFVEIGPGTVLAGLIRKTDPAVSVVSIEKPEQMVNYVAAN